ncbi:MAG: BTAD domain-containing putative transcriptional regulator [Gemmatimonadales bacterium]
MLRINTLGGLWVEGSGPGESPAPKPRRLALLAVLASAGSVGVSRDRVLGILWPDRDEAKARHALSQTLYSLHRDLGAEATIAEPTLRLDPSRIRSDLAELEAALESEDASAVARAYRGPFLEGFSLPDLASFDQWVDAERERLRTRVLGVLERALGQEGPKDWRRDAELAGLLTRLDPLSGRFALRYMEALVSLGDRAAALAHARRHTDAVRQELDAEPDAAITAYTKRLRATGASEPVPNHEATTGPATPRREPIATGRPRLRRLRWAGVGALAVIGIVGGWLVAQARRPGPASTPTVAIGQIRDLASPDSTQVSRILADMLATSLGRLTNLEVVAMSRLLELMPTDVDPNGADARAAAARRAGATEIVEGDVTRIGDGRLQLDFRRVDLRSGMIRRGYRVTGASRFDLVDSATAAIAGELRTSAPASSVTEVTTRSPMAYRFYEEGLRAFYRFDQFAAGRLFRSALREDSSFALAAYYAWRSAAAAGDSDAATLAGRAAELSARASTRDRLIVRAHVAWAHDDPAGFAAAESLVVIYPNDPDALARAAEVFRQAGEPVDRIATLLERAVALDSAASTEGDVCRACSHLSTLANVYRDADSSAAAELVLRRWARLRDRDPIPWGRLGDLLDASGQLVRADSALARAGEDSTGKAVREIGRAVILGDPNRVAARCRGESGEPEIRLACLRATRALGQLRAALVLARSRGPSATGTAMPDTVATLMLDLEAGRPFLAAESFRRLAEQTALGADGRAAAAAAGYYSLAALALHRTNDSLRVRPIEATITTLEQRSASGRRARLSAAARGLLAAEAGRLEDALVTLEGARGWPADYPFLELTLARFALDAGRPAAALGPLRAAIRSRPSRWGSAVNRGELRALLAEAFAALAETDSARVHYEWVARAWRDADPPLDAYRRRAESWLAANRAPR